MTAGIRDVVFVGLLPLLSVGCARSDQQPTDPGSTDQGTTVPVLPPLVLRAIEPELRAIADDRPAAPSDERMRELRDLLETAYLPGYAPARSAAMAQRNLVEQEDVDWILEDALVGHEDATVRAQCAFLLGERRFRPALPALLLRMKYDKDAVVQCWAIGALAKLGNWGGFDQLIALMGREDSAERAGLTAIEVLRAAGREPGESPTYAGLAAMLDELMAAWRDTGVAELAPAAPPVDPELEDLEPLLRARLAERLLHLNQLELRPVDDCRFVFYRLGRVGIPVLARAIGADQQYARMHVLEIVMQLGRPAHALGPSVLPLLGDSLTRTMAARALGSIGCADALPFLVDGLGSDLIEVRAACAAGLGMLGEPAALDGLLARLRDPNELLDVRVEAAAAVARLDVGRRFLKERLEVGDYHEPTLRELLDSIDLQRARQR